jgi:hypothetical protein
LTALQMVGGGAQGRAAWAARWGRPWQRRCAQPAVKRTKRERLANSRLWRSPWVKTSVRSRVEGIFDNLARLFECPLQALLPAR